MKCCVSTDVGTWRNWLTFEPDPDHSPDSGTRYRMHCNARNFISSGKSHAQVLSIVICRPVQKRRVVLNFWGSSVLRHVPSNGRSPLPPASTTVVIRKCVLPSVVLVYVYDELGYPEENWQPAFLASPCMTHIYCWIGLTATSKTLRNQQTLTNLEPEEYG